MPVQLVPPDWSACTSKCRWTRTGALHSCLYPCADSNNIVGCLGSLYRVSIYSGECEYDLDKAISLGNPTVDITGLSSSASYAQAKIDMTITYPGLYGTETSFLPGNWGWNWIYVGSGDYSGNPYRPAGYPQRVFAGFWETPGFTETQGVTSLFSGPTFSFGYYTFAPDYSSPCQISVMRQREFGTSAYATYRPTYYLRSAFQQGVGTVSTDGATGFTMSGKIELYPLTGPNAGLTESVHDIFYEKEESVPISDYSSSVYVTSQSVDEFGGSSTGDHLGIFYNLSTGGYGAVTPSMAFTIPSGYGIRSPRNNDIIKTTFQPLSGTGTRAFSVVSLW